MNIPEITVSSSPHIRSSASISSIMKAVLIALAPSAVVSAYYFGARAIALMLISVISCVLFEFLFQKITKRSVTVKDFSAVVTGVLLAFNLPASSPYWMPVVGSFVAIILVKQLFGGLGQNFMNPALASRAFLTAAYTPLMTSSFTEPVRNFLSVDAVATATPLGLIKAGELIPSSADYMYALFGNTGGALGETCAVALIAGGLFLIAIRVITWHVPVAFISTAAAFTFVFQPQGFFNGYPLYHILAGGLMLGAFFMATDYSSSPVTPAGKIIFGVGCGVITGLIRVYGGYPEGVSYSILLMNLAVPLIERAAKPRVFGTSRRKRNAG